jgi:hypothetical protein
LTLARVSPAPTSPLAQLLRSVHVSVFARKPCSDLFDRRYLFNSSGLRDFRHLPGGSGLRDLRSFADLRNIDGFSQRRGGGAIRELSY